MIKMEWINESFRLSDSPNDIKPEAVRRLLIHSYWASRRTTDIIAKSMKGSLNFGVFFEGRLVGFARVITDRTTFAYLCDVIIDEEFRGHGTGQWMLKCIIEHPVIKETRQMLLTKDAQGFYEKFGFKTRESMVRNSHNSLVK
jgi:ribosomal protein S18 acetylase RimI-like enzyme